MIGSFARRCLRQPGFEGRVLASLREVIYFRDSGGCLLWLALPNHFPHRRAILAGFAPLTAPVGAGVRTAGGCLMLDSLPAIPISQARLWSPPPMERRKLVPWDTLRDVVQAVVARALEFPGRRGFGHLLGLWLDGSGDFSLAEGGDPDARTWQAMFPPARDLILAGRAGGPEAVFDPARKLIGLGPGLSPAGDDFVGGLLFAVWQLARAYPERVRRDLVRRRVLLEHARTATTQVSCAILSDLAHGHAPEPMHTLVRVLLHGDEPATAVAAAAGITRIGNTSGWDLLAGLLTGMWLLVNSHDAAVGVASLGARLVPRH